MGSKHQINYFKKSYQTIASHCGEEIVEAGLPVKTLKECWQALFKERQVSALVIIIKFAFYLHFLCSTPPPLFKFKVFFRESETYKLSFYNKHITYFLLYVAGICKVRIVSNNLQVNFFKPWTTTHHTLRSSRQRKCVKDPDIISATKLCRKSL